MGQCLSSGAAAGEAARAVGAAPRDTALVLMPCGELREYPRPATAARVLEDASGGDGAGGGGWFLCDADRMGFEGPVAAVPAAEELRAGQIYFVLPAAARRRGLGREEVAALAVRASDELSRAAAAAGNGSGAGRRRRGSVAPLVFAAPEEQEQVEVSERTLSSFKVAPPPPPRQLKRRPTPRPGRRRLERFASDLTAIPECEMSSEYRGRVPGRTGDLDRSIDHWTNRNQTAPPDDPDVPSSPDSTNCPEAEEDDDDDGLTEEGTHEPRWAPRGDAPPGLLWNGRAKCVFCTTGLD